LVVVSFLLAQRERERERDGLTTALQREKESNGSEQPTEESKSNCPKVVKSREEMQKEREREVGPKKRTFKKESQQVSQSL